jgi:energy-coupling factor transporter ATP-binding protein EcfA2
MSIAIKAPVRPPMATRRLADVRAEPVRWLWPGHIARGKVTLLAGNPGLGKSQICANLAGIVTTGGRWPSDGMPAEPGAVAFLTAEDDAADTLAPRLKAAGADLDRCYVLDAVRGPDRDGEATFRGFDLSRDMAALAATLVGIGDVRLLVIDPISAYLGGADGHRNAEVRALLTPLSAMASQLGAAIVAVSHLNKGGSADALSRVTGSLAFVATARAAWIVAKDPKDPARRLFLPAKNNLGPDGSGLSFDIEPVTVDDGIDTSRVVWHAEPVAMTADEALAVRGGTDRREEASQRREAERWLAEALSDGPVASDELLKAAEKVGISRRTLFRAKDALGVVASKGAFKGGWAWRQPDEGCHSDATRRVPTKEILAPFADSRPGRGSGTQISAKNAKLSEGGTLGEGCTADEYRAARGLDP